MEDGGRAGALDDVYGHVLELGGRLVGHVEDGQELELLCSHVIAGGGVLDAAGALEVALRRMEGGGQRRALARERVPWRVDVEQTIRRRRGMCHMVSWKTGLLRVAETRVGNSRR